MRAGSGGGDDELGSGGRCDDARRADDRAQVSAPRGLRRHGDRDLRVIRGLGGAPRAGMTARPRE